jgi:uncharacterized membrane-anchored protein
MKRWLSGVGLVALIVASFTQAEAKKPAKQKAKAAQEEPKEEEAKAEEAPAEAAPESPFAKIPWVQGPSEGDLGNAKIKVPEGFVFTGADGTRQFMTLLQNPVGTSERGLLMKKDEKENWFVVFEFDDVGYIEDEDKDDIDAGEILDSVKEGTAAANEERRAKGWGEVEVLGWAQEPKYDGQTNNLTWAIKGKSGDSVDVNYNVRLLGRHGVMSANLIASEAELAGAVPQFNEILKGFAFGEGNRYADYKQGDKIAEYGLAGLMLGGAGVVALKTGILQKFGKLIVVGVIALGAGISKFFKKIFGKKA